MSNYTYQLVAEQDLTERHHQRICNLLVKAFPQYMELFSQVSYYFSVPEYRLWMEDEQGMMVTHLDFERRMISVNGVDVHIAGVGEVATHPDYQNQGLGRLLMAQLKTILTEQLPVDYGILQCREEVTGFYQKVGWHRIEQAIHQQDIQTGDIQVNPGPIMILPIHKSTKYWIRDGIVDLRGLPW